MKKKWIAVLVIAGLLLAAGAVLWFSGVLQTRIRYENPEAYTAGEAEIPGGVEDIDIHWICGNVNIAWHDGDAILLREEAGRPIRDDLRLRWWLDEDTGILSVQYGEDGARMPWNFTKTLTLTLPEGTRLGDAQIRVISGDIGIPALRADSLNLTMTSGSADVTAEADAISIRTTSGSIRLAASGSAEEITLDTASGRIDVTAAEVAEFDAQCTSGGVSAELEAAGSARITATSGQVTASLGAFDRLEISATSGGVTAFLPEEPGFTAYLDMVSGRVACDMPLTVEGSGRVCGDGSGFVYIRTISGNIDLKPLVK